MNQPTDPGRYNRQVILQEDRGTTAGLQGAVPDWQEIGTLWVRIEPLNGRELVYAQQVNAEASHKVTTRWRPRLTITAQMRLVYGARVFNIEHVADRETAHLEIELHCRELKD